ncbi:MAG: hypothetical protein ACREOI_35285, partial [bacterium]
MFITEFDRQTSLGLNPGDYVRGIRQIRIPLKVFAFCKDNTYNRLLHVKELPAECQENKKARLS